MARTTEQAVADLLGEDYASDRRLTPFVRAGNIKTTDLSVKAAAAGRTIGAATLVEIETWVSAYFYTLSDPVYTSKSTGKASGSFLRKENPYLTGAIALDPSGMLAGILSNQTASATWGGKPPSEQTDYVFRS